MTNLDKAKQIIIKNYGYGKCGIFNTRNIVGDMMTNLYCGSGLTIDICYYEAYFEVFGLTNNEFQELKYFYLQLGDENGNKH